MPAETDTADQLLLEASTILQAVAARRPLNVDAAAALVQRIDRYRLGVVDDKRCKGLDHRGGTCTRPPMHVGQCE